MRNIGERGLNVSEMNLARIRSCDPKQQLPCLLDPIADRIRCVGQRTDGVDFLADREYAEATVNDACDEIENLLGVSFVICQVHITAIASSVNRFEKFYNRIHFGKHKAVPAKNSILQNGSRLVAGTEFSAVTVISAFANYWKHRDEWRGDWCQSKGRQAKTVEVIRSLGATQGSSGNMRQGAKALGNENFAGVDCFGSDVVAWHGNLLSELRSKLPVRH